MTTSILASLGLPSALSKQVEANSTSEDELSNADKTMKKDKIPKRNTGNFDKDLTGLLKTAGAGLTKSTLTLGEGVKYKITSPKAGTTVFTKVAPSELPPVKEEGKIDMRQPSGTSTINNLLSAGLKKKTLKQM